MADGWVDVGVVSGRAQWKEFTARLKLVDKKLRLAFNRRIREIMVPLKEEVKSSAEELLPKAGGFAADIAASRFSTSVTSYTVVFKMRDVYDLKKVDEGRLRHPVFGNRSVWVTQSIRSGFWSNPVEKAKVEIAAAVIEAMNEVIKELGL